MSEVVVCFPPQWSPFQPPLSLPSLKAWLTELGHDCHCLDGNIHFYRWLLSNDFVSIVPREIRNKHVEFFGVYTEICENYLKPFSQKSLNTPVDHDELYVAVTGLSSLLKFLSDHVLNATVSLYEMTIGGDCTASSVGGFVESPPWWADAWATAFVEKNSTVFSSSGLIGLSCIGQDQLPFTLLAAKKIKARFGLPVIVGGTILGRLSKKSAIPKLWFEHYLDAVVLHEGEVPLAHACQQLDDKDSISWRDVPGVSFLCGESDNIVSTRPPKPMQVKSTPTPDFSDLPLDEYLTVEVTLPLLASRGCYWGKCEFCHHGMVYQDGYNANDAEKILETITELSTRYGVKSFAFNDEAIPPKVFRKMGELFPSDKETDWSFTGLLKFEKYFDRSDWFMAKDIGFRSLYVGFESASEDNLRRMKKFTSMADITRNLKDSTDAGIWVHCFFFFGFPGETEKEAEQTINYIIDNEDIIGSIGVGTFSLEHGAPIVENIENHEVTVLGQGSGDLDVYYDFETNGGISRARAKELSAAVKGAALRHPKYFSGLWIPRELLLSILRTYSLEQIRIKSLELLADQFVPGDLRARDQLILKRIDDEGLVAILPLLAIFRVSGEALDKIESLMLGNAAMHSVLAGFPVSLSAPLITGSSIHPS